MLLNSYRKDGYDKKITKVYTQERWVHKKIHRQERQLYKYRLRYTDRKVIYKNTDQDIQIEKLFTEIQTKIYKDEMQLCEYRPGYTDIDSGQINEDQTFRKVAT